MAISEILKENRLLNLKSNLIEKSVTSLYSFYNS